MSTEKISLKGIRTHNLKNIDVSFPLQQISVVTGVSGSGKSSLVFDTLYVEAYSRFIETLSSYARQFLQMLPRPDLDGASQLQAAIALKQNRGYGSPRGTVGSLSEISDYLRVLFSHTGQVYCHRGHGLIRSHQPIDIWRQVQERNYSERLIILAPLTHWREMAGEDLRNQLLLQGFHRVSLEDQMLDLDQVDLKCLSQSMVVIDRLTPRTQIQDRFCQSLALAYKVSRGEVIVRFLESAEDQYFFQHLVCGTCHESFQKPVPIMFNSNHPLGACQECHGFGRVPVLDRQLLVPDFDHSLASHGVACWDFGKYRSYHDLAIRAFTKAGYDPKIPFKSFEEPHWHLLMHGLRGSGFTGILGYFAILERKKYKPHVRMHVAKFHRYSSCASCSGYGLNSRALAVKMAGLNFGEWQALTIGDLTKAMAKLDLKKSGSYEDISLGLEESLKEVLSRTEFMSQVGLEYLSLDRRANTLSGGELQRLKMARSLGSALTGTLYCLDEPTAGLHPLDVSRLFQFIEKIKNQGNTIVMVEHDLDVICRADCVVELGPGAGHEGGHLVSCGPPSARSRACRWQEWYSGPPDLLRESALLVTASTHNLKDISVHIPLGFLTAVVGVSGSGKTSLIRHTLYPLLLQYLGQPADKASGSDMEGTLDGSIIADKNYQAMLIGSEPLSRSSRSNIGTYLGLFPEIRALYASQPTAQGLLLKPGDFSFNRPGGRCEVCQGLGEIVEDLSFLGEVTTVCPACQGLRFSSQVLEVQYRGKSFTDILNMTVTEAREFFFDRPKLHKALDAVISIGLGYLTLGHPTSGFSGGEAGRLKMLSLLAQEQKKRSDRYILIFDEPTSGLSDSDVEVLLGQFRMMMGRGHTVVLVDHHPGLMMAADWLIELGPHAGTSGGHLVFEGPPRDILSVSDSPTGKYLAQLESRSL